VRPVQGGGKKKKNGGCKQSSEEIDDGREGGIRKREGSTFSKSARERARHGYIVDQTERPGRVNMSLPGKCPHSLKERGNRNKIE